MIPTHCDATAKVCGRVVDGGIDFSCWQESSSSAFAAHMKAVLR